MFLYVFVSETGPFSNGKALGFLSFPKYIAHVVVVVGSMFCWPGPSYETNNNNSVVSTRTCFLGKYIYINSDLYITLSLL